MTITSTSNPRIKALRQWIRSGEPDLSGRIPVEGLKLAQEALKSGLHISEIYLAAERRSSAAIKALLDQAAPMRPEVVELSSRVFDALVETETPQGILLLAALPKFELEQVIDRQGLLLLAHQLQDPGNLGSMLRSAEAFGVAGVLLSEGSIRPCSQKVIRASAGAVFRLPVFSKRDAKEMIRDLQQKGYRVLAADAGGAMHYQQADYRGRTVVLVGNEGQGAPPELLQMADVTIQIPLAPPVESLNVAIASALILCEAARQRR